MIDRIALGSSLLALVFAAWLAFLNAPVPERPTPSPPPANLVPGAPWLTDATTPVWLDPIASDGDAAAAFRRRVAAVETLPEGLGEVPTALADHRASRDVVAELSRRITASGAVTTRYEWLPTSRLEDEYEVIVEALGPQGLHAALGTALVREGTADLWSLRALERDLVWERSAPAITERVRLTIAIVPAALPDLEDASGEVTR
ncbi:MAG: hypothetical protein H6834_15810 [Planctomycetes bacterium]|nr:hypothetical protein [Planctomycetota bacterium]